MRRSSVPLLRSGLLAAMLWSLAPTVSAQQQGEQPTYSGAITLGARAFVDRPPLEDRAKFEQYGEMPPGLTLDNVYLSRVSGSGVVAELWASDVAFNNQRYTLRISDPGDHYLMLEYNEVPHLYSTQARTLYGGTNPSILRISDNVQSALETAPLTPAGDLTRAAIIDENVHRRDIAVSRETGRVAFRWTPSAAWDVRFEYSNENRTGSAPFGTALNGFNTIEIPAPVSYTTQNFVASAQYVGKLAEDRNWSLAVAYNGSLFHNDYTSVTFDNPFRLSAPTGSNNTANEGRASLAPSNEAHRLTVTGAIDLPFSGRYVGTLSYSEMLQNEPFLPFTINSSILSSTGVPMTDLSLLPARSLHGEIDELLFNNLLTMRFSPSLTGTARFRHLQIDNNTPALFFPEYVRADGQRQTDDRQNYRPAYTRTTSGVDLNWRPRAGWTIGASAGWDRYDRDNREADVTNEYTGRLFLDARPEQWEWLRLRTSVLHAERRFESYDALNNVGVIGYPPAGVGFVQNPLLRKFDMADRNRTRIDASAELSFESGLTITPSGSWRNDQFGDNLANGGELGLKDETYWNAGVEAGMPIGDVATISIAYLHESFDRAIVNRQRGGGGATGIACPNADTIGSDICNWGSEIEDNIDTLDGSGNIQLMPGVLELDLGALYSRTTNATSTYSLGSALVASEPQYPEVRNSFERYDATLRYTVGQETAQRLGWNGDLTLELNYAFERNRMTNWATANMAPYMIALDAGASRSLFLDALNPNYTANVVSLRVGLKW